MNLVFKRRITEILPNGMKMKRKITNRNSYKSYLMCVMYLMLIFFNTISMIIPLGNYLDELIALLAFVYMILDRKRIGKNSEELKIIVGCIGLTMVGLFSNMIFGYVHDISIIVRDVIGTVKFFLAFIGFLYIFGKNKNNISKGIIATSKFCIFIIFVFGIMSIFIDIGMGDSIRYGMRSYRFVFDYYNTLLFVETLLVATIMCERKKNTIFYLMAITSAVLTLRTKSLVVVILIITFKIFETKKNNPIIYGKIKKTIKYVLPVSVLIVLATRNKFIEYISFGKYSSIRIGALVEGWDIFKDHFPFGTGFGTYGTNLSYETGSVLYSMYGRINYSVMFDPKFGYATMSDTYWPSIYTQLGIIGFIIFLYCLFQCVVIVRNRGLFFERNRQAAILIFVYILIATISEASFTNPSGVVSAVMMALLLNVSGKKNIPLEIDYTAK